MTVDQNNNQVTSSQTSKINFSQNRDVMEITITMPTQAYFMSGIRDFTLNLIKNMTEFGEKWAYRFQSIVDELCNNAIEHGSKEGDIIKIIFQIKAKEFIQIIVEDNGTGPKHMTASELTKLIEERRKQNTQNFLIRGRGLPKIVAEWTDELQFTDNEKGGLNTRVKKFLINQEELEEQVENLHHIMLN